MFSDSVQKLLELWKMCDELDVDTGPAMLSPSCVPTSRASNRAASSLSLLLLLLLLTCHVGPMASLSLLLLLLLLLLLKSRARVYASIQTVIPLDAWYSYTFDHFDPRPGSTLFDKFCKCTHAVK